MASIEAHLAQATAHLTRLQDAPQDDDHTTLHRRAQIATVQLERIELGRALLPLLQKLHYASNDASDGLDAEAICNDGPIGQIGKATRTATHLACLLSHQDANSGAPNNINWQCIREWYFKLHSSTRQTALLLFRKWMKQSLFPEEGGCEILKSVLVLAGSFDETPGGLDGRKMNGRQLEDWRAVTKCLIELQIVNDALISLETPNQHQILSNNNWRFDILDEICRPIANRLRYHFLEETAILTSQDNTNASGAAKTNSMERLPEWVFRYLREITDRVLDVVSEMSPLIEHTVQSVLIRLDNLQQEQDSEVNTALQQTIQAIQPQFNPTAYYLREIVRMGRHALRSKSYFSHPDVVGRDAQHGVAKRAIEQLFLFDEYVREKLDTTTSYYNQLNRNGVEVPRLVDVFVSANDVLFEWWIEEEKLGSVMTIRECAYSTLASYRMANSDDNAGTSIKTIAHQSRGQPQLLPPISELFITLIHSIRIKSNAFSDIRSQQHYIPSIIGTLCSEYLDMIHAEATLLRKRLTSRPKSNSSIPSDNDLRISTTESIGLINGVHVASSMVHSCNQSQNEVLDRIAVSLEHVRDAILEDYTSALIETIILERAKFASYTMRCPFLLGQSTLEDHRRGQREGSLVSNLHLSVDLNDSYHVLSVIVDACRMSLGMVEDMISTQSNDGHGEIEVSTTQMLSYGGHAIKGAVATSMCQKLLDIAIDPQGMTPEIQMAGAQQFRFDAMSIVDLFSDTTDNSGTGPIERAVAASHLMSLNTTQLQHLKETLFELSSHNRIGSMFAGRNAMDGEEAVRRLEVESFYSDKRLVMEAESMLGAKGFHSLALEEALSIINRRV